MSQSEPLRNCAQGLLSETMRQSHLFQLLRLRSQRRIVASAAMVASYCWLRCSRAVEGFGSVLQSEPLRNCALGCCLKNHARRTSSSCACAASAIARRQRDGLILLVALLEGGVEGSAVRVVRTLRNCAQGLLLSLMRQSHLFQLLRLRSQRHRASPAAMVDARSASTSGAGAQRLRASEAPARSCWRDKTRWDAFETYIFILFFDAPAEGHLFAQTPV